MGLQHFETDPMEIEESEEDGGPNPIDWQTGNEKQKKQYEEEVAQYRRRVARRLNARAEQADIGAEFEHAEALRRQADELEYL